MENIKITTSKQLKISEEEYANREIKSKEHISSLEKAIEQALAFEKGRFTFVRFFSN